MTEVVAAGGPVRAFTLRFGVVYWLLYIFPFPLSFIPYLDGAAEKYVAGRTHLVAQVAETLSMAAPAPGRAGTSSDGVLAWTWLGVDFALALVGALAWTAARRGPVAARWRALLYTLLRYHLAAHLVLYAVVKILPSQFPPLGPSRILATYAESSPMGLLWRFMGHSPVYAGFGGVLELLGAVLLFFRRTTALGAALLAGVLANVVMLNFCFDVPVKLGSSHLLAICLILLSPNVAALVRLFALGQSVKLPEAPTLVMPSRRGRIARAVTKTIFVGGTLVMAFVSAIQGWKGWGDGRPRGPLEAVWQVESVEHGDACVARHELLRWHRVSIDQEGFVTWDTDGQRRGWYVDYVATERTLRLTRKKEGVTLQTESGAAPADADRLELHGTIANAPARVVLRRVPESELVLVSRGFHWINEGPYWR